MNTKARPLLKFAVMALLLSGCRVVVDTSIGPDGSGRLRSAVVYSAKEAQDFARAPGNESKSICDSLREDAPAGSSFTQEEHAGETHCVTTRAFAGLGELRQLYAGMGRITVRELEWQWGRLAFDIDVDLSDSQEGEGAENEWRVTLPGVVGPHNADRVEGQTLVWEISPGETANLHAESSVAVNLRNLGAAGVLLLASVFGMAVAGGVGAFVLLRRRGPPARAS